MSLVLLLSFLGCEESVNPKGEVKGVPVLHCIMSFSEVAGPMTVEAVLTRAYDVDGLDPFVNETDPFIPGAEITLFSRTENSTMRERSYPRSDTSRYSTRQRYYSAILGFLNAGDTVSLIAKTPQAEVLTASTNVPQWQYFQTSYEFPDGFRSDVGKIFYVGKYWTFTWKGEEDHIFFPRLSLWYRKLTDTVRTFYSKEVPLSFVVRNGAAIPVFPTYQWSNSASYAWSSFDLAMTQISAGDPYKSKYKIDYLTFSLVECDRSLSRYYSSVHGYLDEYSVRLDAPIYTNVNGGIGVFGSCRTTSANYEVNLGYVHSFGYQ
jgi:hypothetical protein